MAKRKPKRKGNPFKATDSEPKFPYTLAPASLRRFLEFIPKKPKPTKVNTAHLRSWGLKDANSTTVPRVLKALDFLNQSGEPTPKYVAFMATSGNGASVLGQQIKTLYAPLFESSHQPHRDSESDLRNLFHIHSGGAEKTIKLQVSTFKTLCDFATFDGVTVSAADNSAAVPTRQMEKTSSNSSSPAIHIDLHIHLPENKSARDYEAIIEDIGRYIYGREGTANG